MPTKAIRERLESETGGEGFDFFLCEKLGWRSVEELRRGMSAAEWRAWYVWYAIRAQARELANMRAGD